MKNRIQVLLAAVLALSAGPVFAAGSCSKPDCTPTNCATTVGCDTGCGSGKSCPTNKTFFTPRSHGVNLALEKTAGWPNLMDRKDQEDAFGGDLQAVFFMMNSTKEGKLARYFLFPSCSVPNPEPVNPCNPCPSVTSACDTGCGDGDCASVNFTRDATVQGVTFGGPGTIATSTSPTGFTSLVAQPAGAIGNVYTAGAAGAGSDTDADLGFFLHNYNTGAVALSTGAAAPIASVVTNNVTLFESPFPLTGPAVTDPVLATGDTQLQLCPEHKAIGVTFNYHQDLKCLFKGLYFELAVPVVNVKNSVGMSTSGTEAVELKKFFRGTRTEIAACNVATPTPGLGNNNAFVNLTSAKMSPCDLSETGVADIDLLLGYKFMDKDCYHVAVNLGVTIPTGNRPDGEWVFDAVVGNNGHVGFGAGLDAAAKVWSSEDCDHSLNVNFAFNYRYLFENDECRTIGLCKEYFGQYMLLIDRTVLVNTQQLTPAANITTLRVDVTPGSQFDGILSLNYNFCGFALDLGYNLFFREREKVEIGCSSTCGTSTPQFPEGKWAIASRNADMCSNPAGVDPTDTPYTNADQPNWIYRELGSADLDTNTAQTPSLTTHKLFVGLGYYTKDWEVPVLVGLGGHYEWAKCDLITNWGFNARLGVGF